jgi:SAM-dependent methyltransferase
MSEDARLRAPAAARNREPIAAVLKRFLPSHGIVLEIASGSGEHVTFLANSTEPGLVFYPSDPDSDARSSIDAWTSALGLTNVRPALDLDAASPVWPIASASAIICINMIHIAPWRAATGLVEGAARILEPGGTLYLYGPFRRSGHPTAPSNEAFDRELRARNPEWGLRNLEDVVALAASVGFGQPIVEEMPANNLSVIFQWKS